MPSHDDAASSGEHAEAAEHIDLSRLSDFGRLSKYRVLHGSQALLEKMANDHACQQIAKKHAGATAASAQFDRPGGTQEHIEHHMHNVSQGRHSAEEPLAGSIPSAAPSQSAIRDQEWPAAASGHWPRPHTMQDTLSTSALHPSCSQLDHADMEKQVAMMVGIMLETSGLPATEQQVHDFERGARASLIQSGHPGASETQRAAVSEMMSSNGSLDVDLSSLETRNCRNDGPVGCDCSFQVMAPSDLSHMAKCLCNTMFDHDIPVIWDACQVRSCMPRRLWAVKVATKLEQARRA